MIRYDLTFDPSCHKKTGSYSSPKVKPQVLWSVILALIMLGAHNKDLNTRNKGF